MTGRIYVGASVLHSKNFLLMRYNCPQNFRLSSNLIGSPITEKSENLVKKKFGELVSWYEEVTGMDEVRTAQNRVLEAEERFVSAQDRRRETNKLVSVIQNKLKDIYAELDTTSRGEERYVYLITQEHKILKEEKRLVEEFQRYEQEERDYFATLSSTVKESHEKERAQSERTKYWSIIGSIIGTVIGVIGSSVNSELKMRELRRLVKETMIKYKEQDISTKVPEALSKHEKELSSILTEMKVIASLPNEHVLGRLNELVHTLDNNANSDRLRLKTEEVSEVLKSLEKQEIFIKSHFDELKSVLLSQDKVGEDQMIILPYGVEERLQQQHQETKVVVACCTIVALVVPLLCKYFGFV